MKKLLFIALGAVFMTAPASVKSQDFGGEPTGIIISKVNEAKLKSDIAKSDAEIADPKKNVKSATWIKRGNTFVDVDARPVNGLYKDLDEATLKLSIPPASTSEQKTINGVAYTVYNSGQANIYVSGGYVVLFTPSIVIDSAALDKAYEAYDKAFTMDPKATKKVARGMEDIRVKSNEDGESMFVLGENSASAVNFKRAYKVSNHPSVGKLDTLALLLAARSEIVGSDFQTAISDLDTVLGMGYGYFSNGYVYYLKANAQAQSGDLTGAFETAKGAIATFPSNEDLLNMVLELYARNNEDSSQLIPIVQTAIDNNPKNEGLYIGLAQIYSKLGDYDNALATIRKATALTPDNFYANFYEGEIIFNKGRAKSAEVDKLALTATSNAQIQQARSEAKAVFTEAVGPFEKALSLSTQPAEKRTVVSFLKEITYGLREDAAMSAKYDQYNAMFNGLQ